MWRVWRLQRRRMQRGWPRWRRGRRRQRRGRRRRLALVLRLPRGVGCGRRMTTPCCAMTWCAPRAPCRAPRAPCRVPRRVLGRVSRRAPRRVPRRAPRREPPTSTTRRLPRMRSGWRPFSAIRGTPPRRRNGPPSRRRPRARRSTPPRSRCRPLSRPTRAPRAERRHRLGKLWNPVRAVGSRMARGLRCSAGCPAWRRRRAGGAAGAAGAARRQCRTAARASPTRKGRADRLRTPLSSTSCSRESARLSAQPSRSSHRRASALRPGSLRRGRTRTRCARRASRRPTATRRRTWLHGGSSLRMIWRGLRIRSRPAQVAPLRRHPRALASEASSVSSLSARLRADRRHRPLALAVGTHSRPYLFSTCMSA